MDIICKLTGDKGSGIKAHIIPASFYTKSKKPSLIINNSTYPKKNWTGIWDSTIVTNTGEKILEELDDYAFKLFKKKNEFEELKDANGQTAALKIEDYDYHKFKLFCLSMLWRMSVSGLKECEGVNLGPHEESIKKMILEKDAASSEKYSVNMFYFFEEYTKGLVLLPVKENFDALNYYRVHFGQYMAVIKVDKRKSLKDFQASQLNENMPMFIIGRQYSSSSEADLFRHMSELNQNRFPSWFLKEANKNN